MALIKKTLQDFAENYLSEANTIWIACSGGVDSCVLLYACQKNLPHKKLHVVHIDHQLLPEAKQFSAQVKKMCETFNLPLHIETINIMRAPGESLEEQARLARYQVFEKLLKPNDALLTAHHQNDQAETLLLHLLRGAGVRGLSGMPSVRTLGKGFLGRPLLATSREQIQAYANQHQLTWIEDPSNQDKNFSRNFIRQTILPLLTKRWPSAANKLAESATHLQEANDLLEGIAKEDLVKVQLAENQLSIALLKKMLPGRLKNVLRCWIKCQHYLLPSQKVLANIINEVMRAKEDAMPCVKWQGAEVRRFQDGLYLMAPLNPFDNTQIFLWDIRKPHLLPDQMGELTAVYQPGEGVQITEKDAIEIRFRQGGESIRLPGREGRQSLKNLFQAMGVPPWLRDRVPLIYVNGELVAIAERDSSNKKASSGWLFYISN